jgi:2-amino-4-hydroxy-6-hydroxymethyldihydropteridine diphosphokinase
MAIIGVGSNIEPEKNIHEAQKVVQEEMTFFKASHFIQTEPVGFRDQADFLNGVWLIHTRMNLDTLKIWLYELESKLGRIRTDNKNGPRTIDLDIVVWNGQIVDDDVFRRDFLKNAIIEVWPEFSDQ